MGFKEDLIEAIREASARRKEEDKALREFGSGWEEFKIKRILALFGQTIEILKSEARCEARSDLHNGSAILEADYRNKIFQCKLTFKPDMVRRVVVCTTSFGDIEQSFDLRALEGAVESLIRDFAVAVIEHMGQAASGPTAGIVPNPWGYA